MKRVIPLFTIVVILLCQSVASSEPALEDGLLSLAEAWDLTLQHSPALRADDAMVEAAGLRARAAREDRLPKVSAGATYTRLSELPDTTFEIPGLGSMSLSESIEDNYSLNL
ncbi:TolC family protein, partial [bacterium]|nr:TolC family protein [candidate division CSSED10-310 bacterium]